MPSRSRVTYANVMATFAAIAAVGGGTFAVADSPGSRDAELARAGSGTINACYKLRGRDAGDVRLLLRAKSCRRGERKIVWNTRGRTGLAGAPGSPGGAGGEGPQGAQGVQGLQGDPGTARAYVLVRPSTCGTPTGPCTPERSRGVSEVRRQVTGTYCVVVPGVDSRAVAAVAAVEHMFTSGKEGDASAMIQSSSDAAVNCPPDQTSYAVTTQRHGTATVDKNGVHSSVTVSTPSDLASDIAFTVIVP